jgi:hypothetical protein
MMTPLGGRSRPLRRHLPPQKFRGLDRHSGTRIRCLDERHGNPHGCSRSLPAHKASLWGAVTWLALTQSVSRRSANRCFCRERPSAAAAVIGRTLGTNSLRVPGSSAGSVSSKARIRTPYTLIVAAAWGVALGTPGYPRGWKVWLHRNPAAASGWITDSHAARAPRAPV